MVDPMSTSTTDLRSLESDESLRFNAPENELPVMWTANDDTNAAGIVAMAHRVVIVDGTYPITADVRVARSVSIADLEELGFTLVRSFCATYGTVVFMTADGVALSGFVGNRGVNLLVSTADTASLEYVVATMHESFPGTAPAGSMAIRSWAMGPHGARADEVRHDFAQWATTRENFPAATRTTIDDLVALERPTGGSMMVWHGAPGTGKTTAIRSLARAWNGWCDVELIIDPEAFFANAGYLMSVLTSGPIVDDHEGDTDDEPAAKRWKLIVVEDCDDLLLRAASAGSNGQLSRLLNVCDGLLGQELNVIVLFTTNAPVSAVHPAVLRPGRCLATVEFGSFTAAEVAARNSGVTPREMTLAELMAAEGGLPEVHGAAQASDDEGAPGYL